jgi:hypothetical protein
MDPMDPDKVAHFKARIGFDQRPRTFVAGPQPAVLWPDPLVAPGVAGAGWAVAADTAWRQDQGSAREWVLRRGPEALMVLAFVSGAGEDGARDFFLARTCNTMTLEVPYVPGPQDLGSLSAQSPHRGAPYLIWVFGNCCVELKAVDTALDLLAIARWLQGHMEAPRARGAAPLPRPDRVTLSALRAPVGQVLTLELEPGEPAAAAGYLMELEYDRSQIDIQAQEGLTARLAGLRPGLATFTVHGLNPATLMTSTQTVTLIFLAPGEA